MARRGRTTSPSERLFADSQKDMFEKSYEERLKEETKQPVECLGMTFANDEERRNHFLEKLREKLKDQEFRKIEGFPLGSDEDILALSDPPYYTACPNPFIDDFIKHYGRPHNPDELYSREPFAVDVSQGKTDPIYKAHSYHTKVPHLAIVPSILHYTEPGDLVLDGFCGTGMTGVAAQWCGSAPEDYRLQLEAAWERDGLGKPTWGTRGVVLNDLSPAATFIAANYNLPLDIEAFAQAARRILTEVKEEFGWMYETLHEGGKLKGRINYTVWSELFTCPECAGDVVFVREALDSVTGQIRDAFPCPHCSAMLNKIRLQRSSTTYFDTAIKKTIHIQKRVPVLIEYTVGRNRYKKKPDDYDLGILQRIGELHWPSDIPVDRMMHAPEDVECWGDKWRAGSASFRHVHHLLLQRPAHALAAMWRRIGGEQDFGLKNMLFFFVDQAIWGLSVLNRYSPLHFSQVNRYLTGVYYVGSQHAECSPWYILDGKLQRLIKAFATPFVEPAASAIITGTAACLGLPDNSIDYIFTDPPFGDNLAYAELNFVQEAFYRLFTNSIPEAIVSATQKKGLLEYQRLMQRCFQEYSRLLKPGRWMTVVFHNSKNAVWNAIQEALLTAGFVVADVRTLDKKQGSFNQAVAARSVKQDLVISVYKPNGGLEARFRVQAGTEEAVWDFLRAHLKQLPLFVAKDGRVEVIAERQSYMLFDRMVAFHVQRNVTVPLSAAEFYKGLAQRFPERDSMYFLPEQAVEYDKKRMTVKEVLQLELAPSDEHSAILWLRQLLKTKPQTFQEIHPQFLGSSSECVLRMSGKS